MDSTLKNLRDVSIEPFKGSKYVVPQTITFDLEGNARSWDMIKSMCSVAVVLYHKTLNSAILVRQFRPPVWAAQAPEEADSDDDIPLQKGFTYELCAGLIDKTDLLPREIAKEEISEECGFDVKLESIHEITSYVHATAHLGTTETIFFAEVDETMRGSAGGGLSEDGESIEVLSLPLEECEAFLADPKFPKSAATIIGLQWLLDRNKAPKSTNE
jgi:UDP-sugar diphosphatase